MCFLFLLFLLIVFGRLRNLVNMRRTPFFFGKPYGILLETRALFINFCLFCAVLKITWHSRFMFSGLCFTAVGRPASD